MGIPEKPLQVEGGVESEAKKWVVIAGIQFRGSQAPLKPIFTASRKRYADGSVVAEEDDDECSETTSATPTSDESRIPCPLTCPPAPRKQKPTSRSRCIGGSVIEFFTTPPDLESVFIRRRVESS